MKRFASLIGGLAIVVAGCGGTGGGGGGGGGGADSGPTVDMAMKPADMTTPPDLWMPPLANTGDPCTKASDCAKAVGATANCLKSTMSDTGPVTWEGGYCTSTCKPVKNDPQTFVNPDCPGGLATCTSGGTCVSICQSVADCRMDGPGAKKYVCAFTSGQPVGDCTAIGLSDCDPPMDPLPQGKMCPMGERCVSYSPDNSYGGCATICDPVFPMCPPPQQGTNGCVVDLRGTDGTGNCINVSGKSEGEACVFLNDCEAGFMCFAQKCRQFCRNVVGDAGMGKACPMGQTCKDIKLQGITIQFKADKTGICTP